MRINNISNNYFNIFLGLAKIQVFYVNIILETI